MSQTKQNLHFSDMPVFLQFREYRRLLDRDKLIKRDGRHYLVRGHHLRPVQIQWSRY